MREKRKKDRQKERQQAKKESKKKKKKKKEEAIHLVEILNLFHHLFVFFSFDL